MRKLILLFLLGMSAGLSAQSDQAPEFDVMSASGSLQLRQYRGKIVYLDFWASWCVPCRKSFPWLNEMHDRYEKLGLKIIAINLDEDNQLAKEFLKQYPAKFTVGFDPAGKSAKAYALRGMPSSYLIDRNSKLIYSHVGFRTDDRSKLEQRIRQALKK